MRKIIVPAMLAGSLLVGGCTAYGQDPLGGILGGILGGGVGGGYQDNNLSQFERAALNACGQQAQQYGQVQITDVRQDSQDTVRVQGRIDSYDRNRDEFSCTFRSDGRIVDFRTG